MPYGTLVVEALLIAFCFKVDRLVIHVDLYPIDREKYLPRSGFVQIVT